MVICHEPLSQAKIAEREASLLVNADILDEAFVEVASETHAESGKVESKNRRESAENVESDEERGKEADCGE